ncbi:MAG: DUF4197 domain-containing protein [Salibacteraceae bacterium]
MFRLRSFSALFLALNFAVLFVACDPEDTDDPNDDLSNSEIVSGLKEALRVGTDTSVVTLNAVDGYYADDAVKILLPPEASVIFDNLSLIPGGSALVENTIKSINRAAEDAAVEAKPIFVDAITNMSIADGVAILFGTDTAATSFLKTNTYTGLESTFLPKIETSLKKPLLLGISAESSYQSLINTYNGLPGAGLLFSKITENTLSEYTTRRALDGLFLKVSEVEKIIRLDPLHRVTSILERVFAELD